MVRFSNYKICLSYSGCDAGMRQKLVFMFPASVLLLGFTCVALLCFSATISYAQSNDFNVEASDARICISLNDNWRTIAGNDENPLTPAFQKNINDNKWLQVHVPHNWDDYYGYRRLLHGNKHGDAWYRKKFSVKQQKKGKRFFLFFEGVGSYATVYLNERKVGEHAGGRTTFSIDVTNEIKTDGSENLVAVRAWHPPFIKDLPWVCGGCSDERGFSEGSQPMGIFRPVHLITTGEIRIEPFGVHAWADVQPDHSLLNINVAIKNYSASSGKNIYVSSDVFDKENRRVASVTKNYRLKGFDSIIVSNQDIVIKDPVLWSVENPYLYKIKTVIRLNDKTVDEQITDFGFRTIQWKTPSHQFFLNGKPVFINGVAEYEHLLGQSHAFSGEQIISRIKWTQAAGFNAFRDGHQPHNLLYGKLFNEQGILWWTQLSAHVWYDTPEFKTNFKQLLKEWVIERRNDPSVILWGLQNESKIPKKFAIECTQLIRSLDPTASGQRLVTTCNGGEGTDWDVPQNWTGTYGGDPGAYGDDLKKQILVGEYGAWRTLDLHSEGDFKQDGPVSEDRFTQLMEKKIRLAESVKDSVAGHFFWLLTSHDNPGRVQGGEGLRELDRIGPVNYKGMLTPWEEPTDIFYMFRSNYISPQKEPMVYIASHTWPNRWMQPGIKDSILVYSNCEEVELFNDIGNASLGKQKRNGIGTSFMWNKVNVQYNVLYAVGYVGGKAVAKDTVVLFHLPQSPNFSQLYAGAENITKPQNGLNYIYRLNCGDGNYTDINGNLWNADKITPGSIVLPETFDITDIITTRKSISTSSWTTSFPDLPANFASQRRIFSPIKNSTDWKLFQTFRYGKDKLRFNFPLPNGEYLIELYFVEPWIGIGGGMNGTGMRIFDIAFNKKIVLKKFDIWKEAGANRVVKKMIPVKIQNEHLVIDFPRSDAGQAIISAIAIATSDHKAKPAQALPDVALIKKPKPEVKIQSWMDIGDKVFMDKEIKFNELPSVLFGAEWMQRAKNNSGVLSFSTPFGADIYIAVDTLQKIPGQIKDFENTNSRIVTDENGGRTYLVYKKRFNQGSEFNFSKTENCIIAMAFRSNMQPAYDLKSSASYKADIAVTSNNVSKEVILGGVRTVVKDNKAAEIAWPVTTGVADIYSITVKYNNPSEKKVSGILQLFDAGNKRMVEEKVDFIFTRTGKWNYITINTGSMINAGHYKVKLKVNDAKDLIISNIDVQ